MWLDYRLDQVIKHFSQQFLAKVNIYKKSYIFAVELGCTLNNSSSNFIVLGDSVLVRLYEGPSYIINFLL